MNLDTSPLKMNHINKKPIIQFSPIRSGSTLVFNILRELFPDRRIIKKHQCGIRELSFPVVVTYRHPLDCIASSIQRYELEPTDEVVAQQISEFNSNGAIDVLKIKNNPNVLLLQYEEFFGNFEVIFRRLETFFGIVIPFGIRDMITERYQIDSVERRVEGMSSFSEYDKATHWHGNHISKYKGKAFYYREFFQTGQIEYLTNIFKKFLISFDYM